MESEKSALEAHPVKSMVTDAVSAAFGAALPTAMGNLETSAGLQDVPAVWVSEKALIAMPFAWPGPALVKVKLQTRAFCGPDWLARAALTVVARGLKLAVTVCGWIMVTEVVALDGLATLPVQLAKA
jgi:hypothetical protein